jgi:hypothetical protein
MKDPSKATSLPFNKKLEVMSPACPIDGIHPLWVINIYRKILNLDWGIFGKAWEWCSSPQGCVDFGIVGKIVFFMKSLGIPSHDIRGRR